MSVNFNPVESKTLGMEFPQRLNVIQESIDHSILFDQIFSFSRTQIIHEDFHYIFVYVMHQLIAVDGFRASEMPYLCHRFTFDV